jgi:hypothetical protein
LSKDEITSVATGHCLHLNGVERHLGLSMLEHLGDSGELCANGDGGAGDRGIGNHLSDNDASLSGGSVGATQLVSTNEDVADCEVSQEVSGGSLVLEGHEENG